MNPRENFDALLHHLPEARPGNMFGYPCLKIGQKPFAFWSIHQEGCVAFKLGGEDHEWALSLPGAQLFDPKGENRPMKNWVEVPDDYQDLWPELALKAFSFLSSTIK